MNLFSGERVSKADKRLKACGDVKELGEGAVGGFAGRVTGYLGGHLPSGAYDFYLCGKGEMIRDVIHLVDQKFPDSLVYTEPFS